MCKFKIGDTIIRTEPCKVSKIKKGDVFKVVGYHHSNPMHVILDKYRDEDDHYFEGCFELYASSNEYVFENQTHRKFSNLTISEKKNLMCGALDPDYTLEMFDSIVWKPINKNNSNGGIDEFVGSAYYRVLHNKTEKTNQIMKRILETEDKLKSLKEELELCLK
jgi:hypothetical protein